MAALTALALAGIGPAEAGGLKLLKPLAKFFKSPAATPTPTPLPALAPVGPGLTHTPPALAPVGPQLFVRDVLGVRQLPPQGPFAPYVFLSWKDAERRLEFDLTHVGAAVPKAKVSVYAYQEPPPRSRQPELTLLSQLQSQPANPAARPQLVEERAVQIASGHSQLTIDFAAFTPSGRPSAAPAPSEEGGAPKLGLRPRRRIGGGGEGGAPPLVPPGAAARAARAQKAFMGYLIGAQGYLRFFVRVEPEGGEPSTLAVVDYGEPQPPAGTTLLEVLTNVPKPEFPDEIWGQERPVVGNSGTPFRWTSEVTGAQRAIWQLSDKAFPENPVLFKDPAINMATGNLQELAGPASQGQPAKFSAEVGWMFPSPGDEERAYYLRVVLLRADETLAAPPSNAIKLVVPAKVPEVTPQQPSTWMAFDTELVGYRPPCFGPTDPYRYLLTRAPDSDLGTWQKLTGKANPGEGDPVYLPPAPPPEDKAWYEKVVDAITSTLAKLKDLAETIEWYAETLAGAFPMIANYFGDAIVSETGIDKVTSAIGLDHAIAAAGWVKGQAATMVTMARSPDYFAAGVLDQAGLPAAQWINLRGKVTTALAQAAARGRPTNPEFYQKLLVPDPDYATHPAYAYLKIHATQKGDTSSPLVASPGTCHLKASGWYSDPQSPGAAKGWADFYDKSVPLPSMCDGMTVVVPIALDYHWMYYQKPKQWMLQYHQSTAIRWTLDYSELKVVQGTAGWGG